jgi:hypothetical protein
MAPGPEQRPGGGGEGATARLMAGVAPGKPQKPGVWAVAAGRGGGIVTGDD